MDERKLLLSCFLWDLIKLRICGVGDLANTPDAYSPWLAPWDVATDAVNGFMRRESDG